MNKVYDTECKKTPDSINTAQIGRSHWLTASIALLCLILSSTTLAPPARPAIAQANYTFPLQAQLPNYFKLELYDTSGLETPRFPSFSPEGDLYVADIATGKIIVLPDRNHDGKPDRVVTFASGLNNPTSGL